MHIQNFGGGDLIAFIWCVAEHHAFLNWSFSLICACHGCTCSLGPHELRIWVETAIITFALLYPGQIMMIHHAQSRLQRSQLAQRIACLHPVVYPALLPKGLPSKRCTESSTDVWH